MLSARAIESGTTVDKAIRLFDAQVSWKAAELVLAPAAVWLITQDSGAAVVAFVISDVRTLFWLRSLYSQAVR